MVDYVHLSGSYIELHNLNLLSNYLNELNSIPNFLRFFDRFHFDNFRDPPREGGTYELTYHNDGLLSSDQIEELIKKIVEVSSRYGCFINLKLKVIDDGDFMAYWIVQNNVIKDIAQDINDLMKFKEKQISYDEAIRKLNSGDFVNFNFAHNYQKFRFNSNNQIATFSDRNNITYLVELKYDQATNLIYPPI